MEATRNVTDVVEAMHHTIGSGPELLGRPLESTTKLLTAPTYGAIRGVTGLVGTGVDQALAAFEPLVLQAGAERGPAIAALNGVLGDHLAATNNPLAIEMRLMSQGTALTPSKTALAQAFPSGSRILLLLHGSSLDEACWDRRGQDFGRSLATDLGYLPLYLRYNTGLHISQNGRSLAKLLEELVTSFPRPVDELVLLGHSMGGLLARSACGLGEAEDHRWRRRARTMVTVGTPHHGAPLERGGNWIDTALSTNRYTAPLSRLGKLRSAGVTDLRYGNVLDSDWQGYDRFAKVGDRRSVLPLPTDVSCYAIAASSSRQLGPQMRGDGLVPVSSALGEHPDPTRDLRFAPERRYVALRTTHFGLLGSAPVYAQLHGWLQRERESDRWLKVPTRTSDPHRESE